MQESLEGPSCHPGEPHESRPRLGRRRRERFSDGSGRQAALTPAGVRRRDGGPTIRCPAAPARRTLEPMKYSKVAQNTARVEHHLELRVPHELFEFSVSAESDGGTRDPSDFIVL